MENKEVFNEEQPAPVIEKISLNDINKERANLEPDEADVIIKNLLNSVLSLKKENIKKAIAYLDKKIEILKNLKNKK